MQLGCIQNINSFQAEHDSVGPAGTIERCSASKQRQAPLSEVSKEQSTERPNCCCLRGASGAVLA